MSTFKVPCMLHEFALGGLGNLCSLLPRSVMVCRLRKLPRLYWHWTTGFNDPDIQLSKIFDLERIQKQNRFSIISVENEQPWRRMYRNVQRCMGINGRVEHAACNRHWIALFTEKERVALEVQKLRKRPRTRKPRARRNNDRIIPVRDFTKIPRQLNVRLCPASRLLKTDKYFMKRHPRHFHSIRFVPSILEQANGFHHDNMGEQKILGAHIRSTDFCNLDLVKDRSTLMERFVEQIDREISEYDALFLCTDAKDIEEEIQGRYSDKVILYPKNLDVRWGIVRRRKSAVKLEDLHNAAVDMMLLSKSTRILSTAGSSFSRHAGRLQSENKDIESNFDIIDCSS